MGASENLYEKYKGRHETKKYFLPWLEAEFQN